MRHTKAAVAVCLFGIFASSTANPCLGNLQVSGAP